MSSILLSYTHDPGLKQLRHWLSAMDGQRGRWLCGRSQQVNSRGGGGGGGGSVSVNTAVLYVVLKVCRLRRSQRDPYGL